MRASDISVLSAGKDANGYAEAYKTLQDSVAKSMGLNDFENASAADRRQIISICEQILGDTENLSELKKLEDNKDATDAQIEGMQKAQLGSKAQDRSKSYRNADTFVRELTQDEMYTYMKSDEVKKQAAKNVKEKYKDNDAIEEAYAKAQGFEKNKDGDYVNAAGEEQDIDINKAKEFLETAEAMDLAGDSAEKYASKISETQKNFKESAENLNSDAFTNLLTNSDKNGNGKFNKEGLDFSKTTGADIAELDKIDLKKVTEEQAKE